MKQFEAEIQSNRHSFLKRGALAGGAATMGAGLMGGSTFASGQGDGERLTPDNSPWRHSRPRP
jgi:hypothetical protein